MKIPILGLQTYLKKPIYLVCGDKRYQTDYTYRPILKKAINDGIEKKLFFENSLDAKKVYSDQSSFSLFSQLKLVVLQFNKPPDKNSKQFERIPYRRNNKIINYEKQHSYTLV